MCAVSRAPSAGLSRNNTTCFSRVFSAPLSKETTIGSVHTVSLRGEDKGLVKDATYGVDSGTGIRMMDECRNILTIVGCLS